jgi:hypothetical protein
MVLYQQRRRVLVNETRVQGFICITRDQRWGWGSTPEESVKAARKAGSRDSAKGNRAIYALPVGAIDAYVDQMGSIQWQWSEDVPSLDESDARRRPGDWIETP